MGITVGSLSYRGFRRDKENFVGRMEHRMVERERERVRELAEEPYCSPGESSRWRI